MNHRILKNNSTCIHMSNAFVRLCFLAANLYIYCLYMARRHLFSWLDSYIFTNLWSNSPLQWTCISASSAKRMQFSITNLPPMNKRKSNILNYPLFLPSFLVTFRKSSNCFECHFNVIPLFGPSLLFLNDTM